MELPRGSSGGFREAALPLSWQLILCGLLKQVLLPQVFKQEGSGRESHRKSCHKAAKPGVV